MQIRRRTVKDPMLMLIKINEWSEKSRDEVPAVISSLLHLSI